MSVLFYIKNVHCILLPCVPVRTLLRLGTKPHIFFLLELVTVVMQFAFKEYGGLGLDYSYAVAVSEELGGINCGSVPMAIGVQTDMATPALAR